MKTLVILLAAVGSLTVGCGINDQDQSGSRVNEPAGARSTNSPMNRDTNKTAAEISNEQGNTLGTNGAGRSTEGGAAPSGANSHGRSTP